MCDEFGLEARLLRRQHCPPGQRRILEIARALVGEPRLLDARRAVRRPQPRGNAHSSSPRSSDSTRQGLAILLVSHDMELMAVAESVHVLNFGEIIARGDMAAIQQNANVREVYLGALTMLEVHSLSPGMARSPCCMTCRCRRRPRGGRDRRRQWRRQDHPGAHHLRSYCARTPGRIIKDGVDISRTPPHELRAARHRGRAGEPPAVRRADRARESRCWPTSTGAASAPRNRVRLAATSTHCFPMIEERLGRAGQSAQRRPAADGRDRARAAAAARSADHGRALDRACAQGGQGHSARHQATCADAAWRCCWSSRTSASLRTSPTGPTSSTLGRIEHRNRSTADGNSFLKDERLVKAYLGS